MSNVAKLGGVTTMIEVGEGWLPGAALEEIAHVPHLPHLPHQPYQRRDAPLHRIINFGRAKAGRHQDTSVTRTRKQIFRHHVLLPGGAEPQHNHHPKPLIMSLTNASPLESAQAARLASRALAILPTSARNDALTAIHQHLADAKDEILAANARDLTAAIKAAEDGELSQSLVKRLDLSKKGKYEDMLEGILDVRKLDDPSMLYCKQVL